VSYLKFLGIAAILLAIFIANFRNSQLEKNHLYGLIAGIIFGIKQTIYSLKNKQITDYKPIIISGFGYFFYNFFTFLAYVFGGEVGRIDTINNSEVFLIIVFEFFFLKHTKGIQRKIFTAILSLIGIIILGWVK
jgi:drug/metabolite transporter (DMT)-like permease